MPSRAPRAAEGACCSRDRSTVYDVACVDGLLVEDVRVYDRALSPAEIGQVGRGTRAAHLAARAQRSAAEAEELFAWWLPANDAPAQKLAEQLAVLQQEQSAIRSRGAVTHVMQERSEIPSAYVLFRGDYDKRRDKVGPATPGSLPPMPAGPACATASVWPNASCSRPEHPLTRSGHGQSCLAGGVRHRPGAHLLGDFGATGELPSHPEPARLARQVEVPPESGWDGEEVLQTGGDVRDYYRPGRHRHPGEARQGSRRIVCCRAARGEALRMDAEMLPRSGPGGQWSAGSPGLGGPSVKPYQPEGVLGGGRGHDRPNTRDYRRDSGDSLYLLGLYTFWKRSAPPAAMEVCNAPSRETCTVRRERTNYAAPQALVTLNDVQFVRGRPPSRSRSRSRRAAPTPTPV